LIPSVLASQLIKGTKDFLTTSFHSSTPAFFEMMDKFVEEDGKLFKGPYISVALPFKKGDSDTNYFPDILDDNFKPYYHQELAFKRLGANRPKPTLVATGTGSGKTESFMYPILDYCYKNRDTKGIKAIIIYPMNALATDQAKRFAKTISSTESLNGTRVGLYIGSNEDSPNKIMTKDYVITDKNILCENPPDILLTNYKMLDFMLMRPKDQQIWKHNISTDVLKFIAVDEIHTFDGAQGTDLASLLRRVRAKLDIKDNSIACIGTSATLGGDTTAPIREFASTIFSEEFDEDSVVKEYRLNTKEFFQNSDDDILFYPTISQIEELDYRNYTSIDEYIQVQYKLWFNKNVEDINSDEFKVKLGTDLKQLHFFKLLLQTLDGEIKSRDEIIDAFIRRIPIDSENRYFILMINSLLALTSWAKNEKVGKSYPPFLFVRVQIWLRELARMVATLEDQPKLIFSHDLKPDEFMKHYPVIHCRDCHATGWGGVKKEGTGEYQSDLDLFYQAFFSNDSRVKFLFPMTSEPQSLSGRILYISRAGFEICDKDDESNGIKVFEPNNIDNKGKSHSNCPFCNSKNSLTILGSRAASLTSVLIGQNFSSFYNDDKKLIAFSDSVQDSAQRAGFFGARSYQFTIRSAIQQALNSHKDDISLEDITEVVSRYWKDYYNDDKQYASILIAPDMEWLRDYDNLAKTDELKNATNLIDLINKRIDWMIHSEYGYKAHIGRTLERCGASVMYVSGFEKVIDDLLIKIQSEVELLRDISKEQLTQFIFGILTYFKNNGAIKSFHIEPYIKSGGENTYQINQMTPRSLYMAKLSPNSRNPRFITNGNFKEFEKISNKGNTTWLDRWILHNFVSDYTLLPDTNSIYHTIFQYLVKEKILLEEDIQNNSVWMINPSKLFITTKTKEFKCNRCEHKLIVSKHHENYANSLKCLRKECSGEYKSNTSEESYYKKLYTTGDIQRIVAKEHTGLLARDDREKVENDFINRKSYEPWKTNLLSATPTLEMGIDIGDLSSVMLCSVPPNGANYLQRIGRAGRTDGNAFNATIANASDHDLYFYEEPNEIMQGNIDAPGVFIDASAILQRQFLAYCIDNWVYKNKIKDIDFPYKLSSVLANIKKDSKDKFPYILFSFISKDIDELLAGFFNLYKDKLNDNSKQKITCYAKGDDNTNSLEHTILAKLVQIKDEQTSIANKISALKKRIKSFESQEAKDKDHEKTLKTMQSELDGLKSISLRIKRKKTFEFFADEGLLPNYAFPQSGVVLKSVIYRKKETAADSNGKRYDTYSYEYERAGSSAISELAPNNSFYAGGRKVVIDQIDMSLSKVEKWIFCDKCPYSIPVGVEDINSCPKCGSEMFADEGQKKEVLRLTQVLATSDDKSSRLKDDKDQRDVKFFKKQLLINFDKKYIEDAYALSNNETAFGFEFIKKVNFKEINFGEVTLVGNDVAIAGESTPRRGFVICKECGKVQFGKLNDEKFKGDNHAFTCEIEDKQDPANYHESLYLFREFDSEAIRLLLPISSMNIDDKKLHSLIASFQLGLKEYFKGSVEHLKVSIYNEVDEKEEYSNCYLILYDTVPGGTGYLKQLMIDQKPLFEVLRLALKKLKRCSCKDDANKDGCYQCLYAYKNNFDRPLISRKEAIQIIENILKHETTIKAVDTVSDIDVDSLSESVLEEMFLSKLKSIAKESKKVITHRGRNGFHIEFHNGNIYEVEQQVELTQDEGVDVYSKADFVLYPIQNNNLKPIVVFTDGYVYHESRVDQDSAQRMAIVKSGNYIVWSLTWEDVEQFDKKNSTYKFTNFLDETYFHKNLFKQFFKKTNDNEKFLMQSSFQWLIYLLTYGSDRFIEFSKALSASYLNKQYDIKKDNINKLISDDMKDEIIDEDCKYMIGKHQLKSTTILSMSELEQLSKKNLDLNMIVINLDDNNIDFDLWSGALRLYNMMQFLDRSLFTTIKALEKNLYDVIDFRVNTKTTINEQWEAIYQDVLPEAQELVKDISKLNIDIKLPIVGDEITDDSKDVICEAELIWEEYKIAIVIGEPINSDDWQIYTTDQKDIIIKQLEKRVK